MADRTNITVVTSLLSYVDLCVCGATAVADEASTVAVVTAGVRNTADSELGVDFDCITDITPNLILASGKRNLANAIARSLLTPRGWLYDVTGDRVEGAAAYGDDILSDLNAELTQVEADSIAGRIEEQCKRDPRVNEADVTVQWSLATSTLTMTILLETAVGPFPLIMKVSALTVEILDGDGETLVSA